MPVEWYIMDIDADLLAEQSIPEEKPDRREDRRYPNEMVISQEGDLP